MRLERVASAVAIVLLVAGVQLPSAAAIGAGEIVSPGHGGALEATDTVTLRYHEFVLSNNSTLLEVVLRLDGIVIGSTSHALDGSGNATFQASVAVPTNMTSRPRTLTATFTESGFTTTVSRHVDYVGGPANTPPALHVASASYVVGMGFRIVGSVVDDGPVRLVANSTYGSQVHWPNATSFVFDVPVNPTKLGNHWLVLRADDGHLATQLGLVIDVIGKPEVIYLQNVTLAPAGLHAAPVTIGLPYRLLEGWILIRCLNSCVGGVAATIDADNDTLECGTTWSLVRTQAVCGFQTHEGPGLARLAWAQAQGAVEVRVVATRV